MKKSMLRSHRNACRIRLLDIKRAELRKLTNFAENALRSRGHAASDGEDYVQSALLQVLRGLGHHLLGRHPRAEDLATKEAFLNYLRGIIMSQIQCQSKSRRSPAYRIHVPIKDAGIGEHENEGVYIATQTIAPDEAAALRDLCESLFSCLRRTAPTKLQPTIQGWEPLSLDSDKIPVVGCRKHIREVRKRAAKIILKLCGSDSFGKIRE